MSKILVVDNGIAASQGYVGPLRAAGFEIVLAADGIEAIRKSCKDKPDLILLADQIPKISGDQVCRILKDLPATRSIPVVIMASAAKFHFETGADGYYDRKGGDLVSYVKSRIEVARRGRMPGSNPVEHSLSDAEIIEALSRLLDRQLPQDLTLLKELDEKKNAFVDNVAHEFKAPLMIIKGFAELLQQGLGSSATLQQKEALQAIQDTVKRLNRLITDLLDISRIEAGMLPLRHQLFDIASMIRTTVQSFEMETNRKSLSVKMEMPPEPVMYAGDQDRLTQVMVNLFGNAVKYSPEGGIVKVQLLCSPDCLKISVEDRGNGLDEQSQKKLFDKFERIGQEKAEGTGLGLCIARDIVALHKGKIWVESQKGKGSKFIFTLPVKPAA